MPKYLYAVALAASAVAVIVLTVVDIARRPPGQRAGQAWAYWSTPRAVAIAVLFALFILGLFLG